jgi:hypothetical protein
MAAVLAHAVHTMLWTETSHAASVGVRADRADVDMEPPRGSDVFFDKIGAETLHFAAGRRGAVISRRGTR